MQQWPRATSSELIVPTATDIAYAAGILDGEGTVCLNMTGKPGAKLPRAVVNITNQNTELLEWLRDRWGGRIYELTGNRRRGWPICWALQFTKRGEARAFLASATPYLIVKRQRADIVTRFLAYRRQGLAYPPLAHAARWELYREYLALMGEVPSEDVPPVPDDDQLLIAL